MALLPAAAVQAQEAYATYDDFSSGVTDTSRWTTFERARTVSGGGLNLVVREYGSRASNVDMVRTSWGEDMSSPLPVTQMRAQLRVNDFEVTGCAANPSTGRIRARMLGTFFNTTLPNPGSFYGDLMGQVYAYRDAGSADAAGVLRLAASAFICTSDDCSVATTLGSVQSLGTVSKGQNVVLQMEWDKPGKRIVFIRDNGATTVSVPYTQSDNTDPARPLKTLQIRAEVENCSTGTRPVAAMDVRWDNVSVNTAGKP